MEIKRYNNKIKEVIQKLEEKYSYASVMVQKEKKYYVISSSNSENIISLPASTGFVIKAFDEHYKEFASSNFTEEELDKGLAHLLKMHSKNKLSFDPGSKLKKDFEQIVKQDPEEVSDAKFLKKAEENRDKIISLSDKIGYVNVTLGYVIKEEVFINRNRELYQKLTRFMNNYSIMMRSGDKSSEIYGGFCRIGGFEHSELDIESVKEDLEILEKTIDAEKIKPDFYDCILAPGVSGMLAHEAFGHGTESDMFLKERARGFYYMDKRVASDLISMWDSADMNEDIDANGSYFFDNEGTLAKKTQIIKDGVLVSGITDKFSATKLGLKITANSRSESFANKVYSRMTNTCFEPGNNTLDEMIADTKHGYLIKKATNGMEDPKGWGMQLEAMYAEEIKDGKLTGKVFGPVTLTGYVPDILGSVSHVSKEFKLSTLGHCGKGHKEWVKVTDGGPYLKLKARLA